MPKNSVTAANALPSHSTVEIITSVTTSNISPIVLKIGWKRAVASLNLFCLSSLSEIAF